MTAEEKEQFIRTIMAGLTAELIAKVPKMPEEWDGWELRQLVKDHCSTVVWVGTKNPSRKRQYNNTRMVKGI